MEVYYEDLKSDKEILDEIQLEKKELEKKLNELNDKEIKIKMKNWKNEKGVFLLFLFPFMHSFLVFLK